jgi:hypothetical protein
VEALLQTASKSMYKRHILLSAPNPALGDGSFAEVPAILLTIDGTDELPKNGSIGALYKSAVPVIPW